MDARTRMSWRRCSRSYSDARDSCATAASRSSDCCLAVLFPMPMDRAPERRVSPHILFTAFRSRARVGERVGHTRANDPRHFRFTEMPIPVTLTDENPLRGALHPTMGTGKCSGGRHAFLVRAMKFQISR